MAYKHPKVQPYIAVPTVYDSNLSQQECIEWLYMIVAKLQEKVMELDERVKALEDAQPAEENND